MNFLEWLIINEQLSIQNINPEEDWEDADVADQIAKKVNIRPNSQKSPTIVAKNEKGEVIGAVFTSWTHDEEATQQAGKPIAMWDFDVVVHPDWQGYDMVGMRLIRQAETERKNLESMHDTQAYTRLWVVNPRLARVLQHPKYGYDPESEYKDGSAHLVKY